MIYESDVIEDEFRPKKTKSHKAKSYQNIIIGAGLSGLLSAILISKDRSSTLLIDKNDYLGGYIYNIFPLKDKYAFFFDNWWPLDLSSDSLAYEILEYMNAFKRFSTFSSKYMFNYINNNENINIPNGYKYLFPFLKKKFPLINKEIESFFKELKNIRKDYNYLLNKKFVENNVQDYLNNYFHKDLSILNIFNIFWIFFGTSYDNLDISIFLYNMAHYLIGGFHYIKDGSIKMINTLEEICHVHGINIKLNLEFKSGSNNSDNLKYINCEHQVNKNNKLKLYGENYFISSPFNNFVRNINSKDPTWIKYKDIVNQNQSKNLDISEITIFVGLKNHPSKFLINSESYYVNENNTVDSKIILQNIYKHGFKASPIIIYNQNLLYNLSHKFSGSLVIKMYDYLSNNPKITDIEKYIKNILGKNFNKNIIENIIYFEVKTPQNLVNSLNRNSGNYVGNLATNDHGWSNRTYQTIFNNVLISSIDGAPGIRGNSIFLTSKFLSNVNDVGLNKYKKFSDIDHMTSTELIKHLIDCYKPIPKYFGKTIGITLDEKNSYFLKLMPDKVEMKEIEFEKAMESNFYVWTFNSALKDIFSKRSSVIKKVFTNKMRVKGGAFYLNTLIKKAFNDVFIVKKIN